MEIQNSRGCRNGVAAGDSGRVPPGILEPAGAGEPARRSGSGAARNKQPAGPARLSRPRATGHAPLVQLLGSVHEQCTRGSGAAYQVTTRRPRPPHPDDKQARRRLILGALPDDQGTPPWSIPPPRLARRPATGASQPSPQLLMRQEAMQVLHGPAGRVSAHISIRASDSAGQSWLHRDGGAPTQASSKRPLQPCCRAGRSRPGPKRRLGRRLGYRLEPSDGARISSCGCARACARGCGRLGVNRQAARELWA